MKNELEKIKEEFAARLNLAMNKKNYPIRGRARVLSKELGVSDKGAGKWINGDAIPETSKIPLIAAFLDISAEWLLSGVGDMHPAQQNSQIQSTDGQQDQLSRPLNELIETLKTLDSKNELNPALIETLKSMVGVATSSKKDK